MRLAGIAALSTLLFLLTACTVRPPVSGSKVASGETASSASMPLHSDKAEPNGGSNPTFSPDGSLIAFHSGTLHTPADLWVMNSDGSSPRRLTRKGAEGFRWAADGRSLYVSVNRKGRGEVLKIDAASGREEIVSALPAGASFPVYSPDGTLFALTAPGQGTVRDLWIGTADGMRLEPVTEKIGVRSFFWAPTGRTIFYEAGSLSYGVGVWAVDLATMESQVLVNKYIGTPDLSAKAGRIAYAYPVQPGEFEVQTINVDGSDLRSHPSPRLAGRWLSWDREGKGIYYLGQEIEKIDIVTQKPQPESEAPGQNHPKHDSAIRRVGETALWHLDLESGIERRISPPGLHLSDFSQSPGGDRLVLAGVREDSIGTELFLLDPASGVVTRLTTAKASAWLPTPSQDSSRIAFFTNEGNIDSLRVVSPQGEELASYVGLSPGPDTQVFWLPVRQGIVILSGGGLRAFTEEGPLQLQDSEALRTVLYADVSIQEDKIILSGLPRYGVTPSLYLLALQQEKLVLRDMSAAQPPEISADLYLQPRWSLDGKRLAFTDGVDVWVMNADDTGRKWITNYLDENEKNTGRRITASHPVWSVGGDRLCYTATVVEGEMALRQLWVTRSDGSDSKLLFEEEVDSKFQLLMPGNTSLPFFDTDDSRIFFTSVKNGNPDIYAVGIENGKIERLTDSGAIYPVLLPEEDEIIYVSLDGNQERLWRMNTHGTQKRPVLLRAATAPASPASAPSGEAVSPSGPAPQTAPAEPAGTGK